MSRPTRAQSFFLELAMVILFFSLAAAVVVRFFAAGNELSNRSRDVNGAVLAAQSMAESLAAESAPSGETEWSVYYDADWNPSETPAAFRLDVSALSEETGAGVLYRYEIAVTAEGETEPLFTLDTARYRPEKEGAR